jgi:2-haloacid dehalogenase
MLGGEIPATVRVLAELRARRMPLYALTNWSAEKFPIARHRFPFLGWFRDIVVSGEIAMRKPEPGIFRHLLTRHGLGAWRTLFVDDSARNVAAARAEGMQAVQFTSPEALRVELAARGLLG